MLNFLLGRALELVVTTRSTGLLRSFSKLRSLFSSYYRSSFVSTLSNPISNIFYSLFFPYNSSYNCQRDGLNEFGKILGPLMLRSVSKPRDKSRYKGVVTVNVRHTIKKFKLCSTFCRPLFIKRESRLPMV